MPNNNVTKRIVIDPEHGRVILDLHDDIDPQQFGLALDRLFKRLAESTAVASGQMDVREPNRAGAHDGGPLAPELVAASRAALAIMEFTGTIDPQNNLKIHLAPKILTEGLSDLIYRRKAPSWLQPTKVHDNASLSYRDWIARMLAAEHLQILIDSGVPVEQAQNSVKKILDDCGIDVKSSSTIYTWLKRFRSGKVIPTLANDYNERLSSWEAKKKEFKQRLKSLDINRFNEGVMEQLRRELADRGFRKS